jgi:hypothetical protein
MSTIEVKGAIITKYKDATGGHRVQVSFLEPVHGVKCFPLTETIFEDIQTWIAKTGNKLVYKELCRFKDGREEVRVWYGDADKE